LPIIKVMKKNTPAKGNKKSSAFAKGLIRGLMIIIYVLAFFGFTGGFYAHKAAEESEKTFVRYTADNMPICFPVLTAGMQDNGQPTVHLDYLNISEDLDGQATLHQIPGEGQVQVDKYDSGYYRVEPISAVRKKITLDIWVSGGDRREKYVYEVEGARVYPHSYQLMAYFGWSFSAIPPALLAVVVFIFFCEIFYRLISKRIALGKLKLTPQS
jgi:hypothetical protein